MQLSEYEVAEDMLIDGLKIVQDTRLYRFTSDSVLLSRFARAKAGDKVADFCAGSGIVAFHFYALHRALKGLDLTLFEMQRRLSELSEKTALHPTTISHHMARLVAANLVECDLRTAKTYYTLNKEYIIDILDRLRAVFSECGDSKDEK